MNTELQEPTIGPFCFDQDNITLDTQQEVVAESRELFISFLNIIKARAANTFLRNLTKNY